jgi:hypothetical protein
MCAQGRFIFIIQCQGIDCDRHIFENAIFSFLCLVALCVLADEILQGQDQLAAFNWFSSFVDKLLIYRIRACQTRYWKKGARLGRIQKVLYRTEINWNRHFDVIPTKEFIASGCNLWEVGIGVGWLNRYAQEPVWLRTIGNEAVSANSERQDMMVDGRPGDVAFPSQASTPRLSRAWPARPTVPHHRPLTLVLPGSYSTL